MTDLWVQFGDYLDLGKSEKGTDFNQVIRLRGGNCLCVSARLNLTSLARRQTWRIAGASPVPVSELSQLFIEHSYCRVFNLELCSQHTVILFI